MEGLSNTIDEATINGDIHGSRISANAPEITHLLFADDSFMFFKATIEEAKHVKKNLVKYEEVSGQSVNFQKSGVMFSSNVKMDKQKVISDILDVHKDISND